MLYTKKLCAQSKYIQFLFVNYTSGKLGKDMQLRSLTKYKSHQVTDTWNRDKEGYCNWKVKADFSSHGSP